MYEALLKYIRNKSQSPLSESEIAIVKEVFIPKKFKKRQFFLQEGEICKYSAFIVKGAMRQYSVDEKGGEHIVRLSIENWWAADRESFTMLTPSVYNIDAWEETDALLITKADMTRLNSIPAIREMATILDQNHTFAYQKRVNAAISYSAEKRYEDLARTYPEFLARFPPAHHRVLPRHYQRNP